MREDQYRQLLSVGRTLVETVEPERVLERLLEVARDVTGARYAAIGVLDPEGRRLDRFLTAGIDADRRREIGELPQGRGVLGELIRRPAPLRLDAVGDHPSSYGFPPGHPEMSTFLGVPVQVGDTPFGNLYLTEKEGGPFDADDEEAVMAIAEWAAVAIQNARLHDDVTRQRDELERSVETLETTSSIAKALAGETNLDRILELIAKRGRAVVDARLLIITMVTPDGVTVAAAAGEGARDFDGMAVSADGSATAMVLENRRPMRFGRSDAVPLLKNAEIARRRFETALIVPLVYRGRGIGALGALDCLSGASFTAEDERLLEAFADSAATAVGTAQTVDAEQRRRALRAAEAERRRWARELHDDTLQELAAVRLGLSMGQRSEDVDQLRAAMQHAMGELDTRIGALRALIADLRPAALDELGVASALENLVQRVEARGVDVDLSVSLAYERGDAPTRHAPELEDSVYRIVQEALTNVLKHANATRATVSVVEHDGEIDMQVTDDGDGFATQDATVGYGIVGMRERVDLLGGTLEIASTAGQGTTLRVRVPEHRRPPAVSRAS